MTIAGQIDVNAPIKREQKAAPFIIDADAHVNPPPTMWETYLPKAYSDLAPKLEQGDDCDWIIFEGQRKKVNLIGAQAGREGAYKIQGKLSDARVGGWMAPARIDDMDADGIDVALLFGGGSLGTGNFDLFLESFGAYNRWLADFCSHDPKRLKGVAYLPMLDVDHTIKLVREAAAMGMKSVNIPAFPQSSESLKKWGAKGVQLAALTGDPAGERQYRDAEFDPLWATFVELDMGVSFHLGTRGSRFNEPVNFLPDLPMGKVTMAEPIAIMIYGGVFDRFPKLRLGSIESGSGWFPWLANYMDRTWTMQAHWVGNDIKHPPSYYFDQNIYTSFISDPTAIKLRDDPGGKNIMWSSDYPHSETTFPHSQNVIRDHFKGVPDKDRDWIVAGCAKKFFGLDDA
jgi:predicted TIM-barrel fold metal-dependent hydrolase